MASSLPSNFTAVQTSSPPGIQLSWTGIPANILDKYTITCDQTLNSSGVQETTQTSAFFSPSVWQESNAQYISFTLMTEYNDDSPIVELRVGIDFIIPFSSNFTARLIPSSGILLSWSGIPQNFLNGYLICVSSGESETIKHTTETTVLFTINELTVFAGQTVMFTLSTEYIYSGPSELFTSIEFTDWSSYAIYDNNGWNLTDYSDPFNNITMSLYDSQGYNREGYNAAGYNAAGYNAAGYNAAGYNAAGYNAAGWNAQGFYFLTGTQYDSNGLDINGNTQQSIDPTGVPLAPTNITVVPSATSALITWIPPSDPSITGYKIYSIPNNKLANLAASDATSLIVTGLKNGTSYKFSVVATNSIGTSYTARCTPSALPGVPKVRSVGGNGQVTLSWVSKPAAVPTTSYTVTCNQTVSIPDSPTSPLVITGLTNGTPYIFSVSATNIIGSSLTGLSKATIPTSVPSTPTSFAVLAGIASFQVTWTAPTNGGLPIKEYTITYIGQTTIVAKAKPVSPYSLMITKLLSGTYNVSMVAKNKLGSSLPTETITVTVT